MQRKQHAEMPHHTVDTGALPATDPRRVRAVNSIGGLSREFESFSLIRPRSGTDVGAPWAAHLMRRVLAFVRMPRIPENLRGKQNAKGDALGICC